MKISKKLSYIFLQSQKYQFLIGGHECPLSSKKPKRLQRLFQVYFSDINNNIIEFCLTQKHSVASRNQHFF